GRTVDFYLSSRRNTNAAYRFLGKILNNLNNWQIHVTNTKHRAHETLKTL
ncbi:DDE-type integrase/transposase/recombinase, partial [Enterobacter hormaechei]